MFGSQLLYRYNDSSTSFVRYLGIYNKEQYIPLDDSQFVGRGIDEIFALIRDLLSRYLHPLDLNNLLIIVALILSLYFSYKLFHFLTSNIVIGGIFAFLASTSTYFIYRIESVTQNLYFIFIFPFVVYWLLNKKQPVVISLFLLLMFGISSYYAYFSTVLVVLWYLAELVFGDKNLKRAIYNILTLSAILILGFLLFFRSQFLLNSPSLNPDYRSDSDNQTTVYRPIEDWYNFSFRPWYFVIPPQSSLLFGDFSKSIHERIENTNYFLADDYTEDEMAGVYIGWHFFFGTVLVLALLVLNKYGNSYSAFATVYKNKKVILQSCFVIFFILLFSFPPMFTVRGVEIYTPSYLIYQIVPVFRVLVRWISVVYLLILIINVFLVQDLYNLAKTRWQKVLFVGLFILLNLAMFAVKLPVLDLNKPPQEIAYLRDVQDEKFYYLVFPEPDYYSVFWILAHRNYLLNYFVDNEDEKESTANYSYDLFVTKDGVQELLDNEAKYLVFYESKVGEGDLKRISETNPEIITAQDIKAFFDTELGNPVYLDGNVYIYEIDVKSPI